MNSDNDLTVQAARAVCEQSGQQHLLRFWDELDAGQRRALLADIGRIDFRPIRDLVERFVRRKPAHEHHDRIEAPPVDRRPPSGPDRFSQLGFELIAAGKVAALVVAGGQGTRLGYDGPKGCFSVSPVEGKSLFQLFAQQIHATGRRAGRPIRWYIMTSPANDESTRAYFHEKAYFGLDAADVMFFQQGVMPAFGLDGKILLEQKYRVALSPDGHGGTLLAMVHSGALSDMQRRGIEYLSYFQVDNPLVRCVDPYFIGDHVDRGCEMSCKVTPKADDFERVGNVVMADGRVFVIEYSDLPESLATARNSDGSRRFNASNLAIHLISRRFIERLTADPARFALPWHRAEKKVPFVDLASGLRVEPGSPNAIKLEAFIFDALPLAKTTPLVLEIDRHEEFSPVKNATGTDSLASAQRDMIRRAARWLEAVGIRVPRGGDGEPAVAIEISPLAAMEAADLMARRDELAKIRFDRPVLIE